MTQPESPEIVPPGWLAKRNRPSHEERERQIGLAARVSGPIVTLWRMGFDTSKIAKRIGCAEYAVDTVIHNSRLWSNG